MKTIKDLKMKEKAKILEMSEKELTKEVKDSEKRMYEIEMKLKASELKQTHLVKHLRRYIAVLKTIASQKGYSL